LLSVKCISVHYGKAMALEDISMNVDEGSVVSIIGANGSGKSTTLCAISAIKRLTKGEILFNDKRIDKLEPTEIVKLGIIHVPEGRRLFPYLTVENNLKLGACLRKNKNEVNEELESVYARFPRLKERYNQQAGTLSGGEQQMLAIGRGLMANPKLLMLDEPSLGLAPIIIDEIARIIRDINQQGISVLLVEQNIPLALGVSNKGYLLHVGKVILSGDISTFREHELIKQAYLGG
jgi:branched-chain amino acid transport system ATP-binding protein